MKKKLPVFVFRIKNIQGWKLISSGIKNDSDGNKIVKSKKYNWEKDCNGIRAKLINDEKEKN